MLFIMPIRLQTRDGTLVLLDLKDSLKESLVVKSTQKQSVRLKLISISWTCIVWWISASSDRLKLLSNYIWAISYSFGSTWSDNAVFVQISSIWPSHTVRFSFWWKRASSSFCRASWESGLWIRFYRVLGFLLPYAYKQETNKQEPWLRLYRHTAA